MIRQARVEDISRLEELYRKRVIFNDIHDIHQWSEDDVTWKTLSKTYSIDNFYVLEEDNKICATVCFVDYDPTYWPHMLPHASYYLHKICVDPEEAKKGYADKLIAFFKSEGKRLGFPDVRLDVRAQKTKLRSMYESHGFQLVEECDIFKEYRTALYKYTF